MVGWLVKPQKKKPVTLTEAAAKRNLSPQSSCRRAIGRQRGRGGEREKERKAEEKSWEKERLIPTIINCVLGALIASH
jgi:hypothetical protein